MYSCSILCVSPLKPNAEEMTDFSKEVDVGLLFEDRLKMFFYVFVGGEENEIINVESEIKWRFIF